MSKTANIVEIFSSIQGEGPYVGERHLFVRFQGCSLRCSYCDTPTSFIENSQCRVEKIPFSKKFDYYKNPISLSQLNNLLESFNGEKVLSVTGGEPLEQVDFLREWLPSLKNRYRILLETAGIHVEELRTILRWIDIVSMDIKLPSVAAIPENWEAHRAFAEVAQDKMLYMKVVVSSEADQHDLEHAIRIAAHRDPDIPFILQPASESAGFQAPPTRNQLKRWQEDARESLSDVRIVPQVHKALGIL